jgi:hypothetical protein
VMLSVLLGGAIRPFPRAFGKIPIPCSASRPRKKRARGFFIYRE